MFSTHVINEFDALLDKRLNEADFQRVQAHLAGCVSCREALETHKAVWEVLATVPAIQPSTGFADRVLRNLDRAPEKVRSTLSPLARWVYAPATGLALATLMIALVLLPQMRTRGSAKTEQPLEPTEAAAYQQIEMLHDLDFFAVLDQLENEPSK